MSSVPSARRRADAAASAARPARAPVVTYARVSSKDQEREGFSIPAQQRLLNTYAEDHGFTVVKEFVDVETAKKAGRTNFEKMLSWLKANRKTCRTILVEKTDRLYRNLKDWVVLDELNIEIHLVKEGGIIADDARSADKFMHGIRVLMAKNYIDNLREEVTKGMNEKAAQGIWPTTAPFGYLNVVREDGKRVIAPDPEKAPIVLRLFEAAVKSDKSIALLRKELTKEGVQGKRGKNPMTRSTVHRILHNLIYTGEYEWRGRLYHGTHQPLVTRELFERVQDRLTGRYNGQREVEQIDTFAYAGLIKCGHCGCAMSAQIKKERYIYYRCTGHKGRCDEPYVREEVLTEAFAKQLRRIRISEVVRPWLHHELRASHADQQTYHRDSVQRLESEVAKLQARVDNAYIDKLDGNLDTETWRRLTDQWNEQIRTHRRSIAKHEDAKRSYIEEGIRLLDIASRTAELFEVANTTHRRKLLFGLFSNSYWSHGELRVDFVKPYVFLAEFNDASEDSHPLDDVSPEVMSRRVIPTGFEPVSPE